MTLFNSLKHVNIVSAIIPLIPPQLGNLKANPRHVASTGTSLCVSLKL